MSRPRATVRSEVALFDDAAKRAVDAYTDDQRVVGNSLLAEARQHGAKLDMLLASLDAQLAVRAAQARGEVRSSSTTAVRMVVDRRCRDGAAGIAADVHGVAVDPRAAAPLDDRHQ